MTDRQQFPMFLVLAILAAVPAVAQEDVQGEAHSVELLTAAASPSCSAGVVYDDGVFNNGYSLGNGDPGDSTMVMKFDLPAGTTGLDQVCACFTRSDTGPSSMSYQVVVYDDNGAGGQPGTLLGTVNATATGLSSSATTFYGVSLSGSGILLPDNGVYIGVRWPGGPDFFLCGDRTATTPQRANYGSGNQGASWTSLSTLFPATPPRALGIRADTLAAGTCVPSDTAMCLNNNRFKVEATFRTGSAPSAAAHVFKLTDETGYFWFFTSTNVEVVVKVLNGCGLNNRYWVFAAGLTNVEVILTVTDTATGVPQTYVNPLNRPFPPLQDTSAFATCP